MLPCARGALSSSRRLPQLPSLDTVLVLLELGYASALAAWKKTASYRTIDLGLSKRIAEVV